MPSSNQGWPEDFGFQLGGVGPSYILSVEEGSSAHLAGLQAGDQVLEIEGHNVSTLGPQAVVAIAQTQKNIPPSIGVVSRIQQVSHLLHPSQHWCPRGLMPVDCMSPCRLTDPGPFDCMSLGYNLFFLPDSWISYQVQMVVSGSPLSETAPCLWRTAHRAHQPAVLG